MKKIDFLFFWETKVREIESIILIGTELEKQGYRVEYISFAEIHSNPFKVRKIKSKGVKVAVMPSLYHDEEIRKIVYAGAGECEKIVNLRWEQVYRQKEQRAYDLYQFPKGNAKKCLHLCWGAEEAGELIESGISKDNVRVTGPVQMDFVRKEFKSYFLSREELFKKFNLDTNKKVMLFISSFSVSSMSELHIRVDESQPGQRKGFLTERKKQEEFVYNTFLEWLEQFLKKNTTIEFIYRPHPVERKDRLDVFCGKYKNFHIISELNVKQWILCCDYVCTWISTSIAEAYFAGVNCAIIRPTEIPSEEDMTIYKNAKFTTTVDDFISLPTKSELFENSLDSKILNDYYCINSDKPSFKIISDVLVEKLNMTECFNWDVLRPLKTPNIVIAFAKSVRTKVFCKFVDMGILRKSKVFSGKMNLRIENYIVNRKSMSVNRLSRKEFKKLKNDIEYVFFSKLEMKQSNEC
ncbi:MAG: hypothetical protein HDR37_05790 [Treponema sp.]|nr:hypothetical protein [Treponema sp.]